MGILSNLIKEGEAPKWLTEDGYQTISRGYLLPDETPKQAWLRVCNSSAHNLGKPDLADKFFDIIWRGWFGLASPVFANMGTNRAYPISCFSNHVEDSIQSILDKNKELGLLSKAGGGVGIYMGELRSRGALIRGGQNGKTDGVIPFSKIFDSTVIAISQGYTRRGAAAVYLPIEHGDSEEFLRIRRPSGDVNRQCLNLHHGLTVTDAFMHSLKAGDRKNRELWQEVLKTRVETGEPYLMYYDNVQKARPESYIRNNLSVKTSNICSEILLFTDPEHTFVCCLSSMNLYKWEEWKDTDAVQLAIWFLDGVMQEFINKAEGVEGYENAVRFAQKGRAIGLGVFGFHTLLQDKGYDIEGLQAKMLNNIIFKRIREQAEIATQDLAKEYGEPEWCKGLGRRNTHLLALAPTATNATISGGVSPTIEPWAANVFSQKTAKGTFIKTNKLLERDLESIGKNTPEIWKRISHNEGSIQNLDLPKELKAVYKTAKEINQFSLVSLAADRDKFIDQGQSLNLFFPANSSPKYIHEVHYKAWESGIKTLYYLRTSSLAKGDVGTKDYERKVYSRSEEECISCEG